MRAQVNSIIPPISLLLIGNVTSEESSVTLQSCGVIGAREVVGQVGCRLRYGNCDRESEGGEGGREGRRSWPHKIAEGDRGGERGGLFKRGANEYSEAHGGVRAPGDPSWKRPGEMVQITANIQISKTALSPPSLCKLFSLRMPAIGNYVKECNQNRDSPCKFLRECRCRIRSSTCSLFRGRGVGI